MTEEEILTILNRLSDNNLSEDSYFGFFNTDHEDYKHIKANKEGLRRYASRLLQISVIDNDEYWDLDEKYIDPKSDHKFAYVQKTDKNGVDLDLEEIKHSRKDNLILLGLYLIVTLLVLCAMIGLIMIIKWIF